MTVVSGWLQRRRHPSMSLDPYIDCDCETCQRMAAERVAHRKPSITDPISYEAVVDLLSAYMVGNGATVTAARDWATRVLAPVKETH